MKTEVGKKFIDPVTERFKALDTPNKGFHTNIPQTVQRCVFLEPNDLTVLMALLSFADEQGHCNEYQMTIARKVRIKTAKTMRKSLDALLDAGFISEVKHNNKGLPNEYQILDWTNNPYLLLSEAVQFVEIEIKKQGVTASKAAKILDELIYTKEIYLPIINTIGNSYDLAVKSVVSYVNEVIGKSFDIQPNREIKADKVVPMPNKKTSGYGGFQKKKSAVRDRNREWIPNPNQSGKTGRIKFGR